MEKLIFKKLYVEIFKSFLIILFTLSTLIWLLQAVNYLDIVSEDGHGLGVYFQYTSLNLPKIISKTYLLSYFLALCYVLSKYEETNQLLVFWTFGINKIVFLNKLLKISFLFFIFSFILYFLISPYAQNKARFLIKNSNLDFFTSLIKSKSFIDTVEGLTFFVDNKINGQIQKIILKDITNQNKVQIIMAKKGEIIEDTDLKSLVLFNGKIINSDTNKKLSIIDFKQTAIDLKKYQTKTTTTEKIQELSSLKILKCALILANVILTKNDQIVCNKQIKIEYFKELYKRVFLPLVVFIVTPITAFIILRSSQELSYKLYKYLFFLIGIFLIVISEISLNIISESLVVNLMILCCYPLLFIIINLLFRKYNKINI